MSDWWHHGLCVCALCVCISVVKTNMIFGIDEALEKGKTDRIERSVFVSSLH